MNKQFIYKLSIAVLFISNLLFLSFFFIFKPPHPPKLKQLIINKLGFDNAQIAKFELLIKSHQQGIIALEDSIKTKKTQLYISLAESSDSLKAETLTSEIGKIQFKIEQLHYKHFAEIKNLCRKEQLQAFKELSTELVDLFFKQRMKRK